MARIETGHSDCYTTIPSKPGRADEIQIGLVSGTRDIDVVVARNADAWPYFVLHLSREEALAIVERIAGLCK